MSFCLFAEFSDTPRDTEVAAWQIRGLQKVHVYIPTTARDPFLNDGTPPALVLQLYFESLTGLESACDGELENLKGLCQVQAMLVRPFAVPEPSKPGCTYLVAYEGQTEDETAWHREYLRHHPSLMAQLPGIRELEVCTQVEWISDAGWKRRYCMQRNKVSFDSPDALTAALHSPVRRQMRSDYLQLPTFNGRVSHHAMETRVISPR